MTSCLNLSAADTFTGALDWFDCPLVSLNEWGAAVVEVQKKRNRKK